MVYSPFPLQEWIKIGKNKGIIFYNLKEENTVKNYFNVNYTTIAINDPYRHIFCMYKSYTHNNRYRHDGSLFDPNNYWDLGVKYQHRGERSCFIMSIIYKDTQAAAPTNGVADQDPEAHNASIFHDTLVIFKGSNKHTED